MLWTWWLSTEQKPTSTCTESSSTSVADTRITSPHSSSRRITLPASLKYPRYYVTLCGVLLFVSLFYQQKTGVNVGTFCYTAMLTLFFFNAKLYARLILKEVTQCTNCFMVYNSWSWCSLSIAKEERQLLFEMEMSDMIHSSAGLSKNEEKIKRLVLKLYNTLLII